MSDPACAVFSDDEESDDKEDIELPSPPPSSSMRQRASVSAEAFGTWNKRVTYVPPLHAKEPEQIAELTSFLSTSFLFYTLESKDLLVVVLAMKGPIALEPGARIITEGDGGDHLYVVQDGILDCTKVLDGRETVLKTCSKGDLFGELALLYNCPRAASVVSRDASAIWELDRATFNNIVMEGVDRKRRQVGDVLRSVPLFGCMTEGEVESIIDVLKMEKYTRGTTILTQGDAGDRFFIVYEGQVVATKVTPDSPDPITYLHEAGDYFGELSLLQNAPRAASVVAGSDEVTVLSMDRSTFKRLMGAAEEFLQRGAARYA